MCRRFFPDIIVAADLNSLVYYARQLNRDFPSQIKISDCLKHQEDYAHFGLPNVFIGYEGKSWTRSDYLEYFKNQQVCEYFNVLGDDVIVDIEAILMPGVAHGDSDEKRIREALLINSYDRKALECLGLLSKNEKGA